MRHQHVVGVDLLRFFAACLVVTFHLGFFYLLAPGNYPLTVLHIAPLAAFSPHLARYGFIGVEIFFVISGYVISFSVEGRSRAQYARARFLRLWPTVWICATICLVAAILTRQDETRMLLLLWLRSMVIVPRGPWIDGVYWTLPIEIAFYVLVFCIGGDAGRRRRLALAIGGVSIGYWACYRVLTALPHLHHLAAIADYSAKSRILDLALVHHGLYFALGILIHTPVRRKIMVPFCILALGAAFIEIDVEAARLGGVVSVVLTTWYAYAIWIACLAYLLAAIRYNAVITVALGQGRVRFLKALGALTYPLYLMHVIVAWGTAYALIRLSVPPALAWLAGPAAAIACATVVAVWIEPPVRRFTGLALDDLFRSPRLKRRVVTPGGPRRAEAGIPNGRSQYRLAWLRAGASRS